MEKIELLVISFFLSRIVHRDGQEDRLKLGQFEVQRFKEEHPEIDWNEDDPIVEMLESLAEESIIKKQGGQTKRIPYGLYSVPDKEKLEEKMEKTRVVEEKGNLIVLLEKSYARELQNLSEEEQKLRESIALTSEAAGEIETRIREKRSILREIWVTYEEGLVTQAKLEESILRSRETVAAYERVLTREQYTNNIVGVSNNEKEDLVVQDVAPAGGEKVADIDECFGLTDELFLKISDSAESMPTKVLLLAWLYFGEDSFTSGQFKEKPGMRSLSQSSSTLNNLYNRGDLSREPLTDHEKAYLKSSQVLWKYRVSDNGKKTAINKLKELAS
jgi:hypothetical protein